MGNLRKRHDAALKAKVASEAVKVEKTISEISSEYGVHPNQVRQWRKQLLDISAFTTGSGFMNLLDTKHQKNSISGKGKLLQNRLEQSTLNNPVFCLDIGVHFRFF